MTSGVIVENESFAKTCEEKRWHGMEKAASGQGAPEPLLPHPRPSQRHHTGSMLLSRDFLLERSLSPLTLPNTPSNQDFLVAPQLSYTHLNMCSQLFILSQF